jgi:hypothetical protein
VKKLKIREARKPDLIGNPPKNPTIRIENGNFVPFWEEISDEYHMQVPS